MSDQRPQIKPAAAEQPWGKGLDETPFSASFSALTHGLFTMVGNVPTQLLGDFMRYQAETPKEIDWVLHLAAWLNLRGVTVEVTPNPNGSLGMRLAAWWMIRLFRIAKRYDY